MEDEVNMWDNIWWKYQHITENLIICFIQLFGAPKGSNINKPFCLFFSSLEIPSFQYVTQGALDQDAFSLNIYTIIRMCNEVRGNFLYMQVLK